MLDFQNAALLTLVVFAAVEGFKRAVTTFPAKYLPAVSVAIGVAVTFLVRATDWAGDQVIGGRTLNNLNVASCVLVGVMLGALAVAVAEARTAVKNIGQNAE